MCNRIIFVMLLVMAVKVRAECEKPFFGENRILAYESGQQTFPDGATVKFKCSTGYVPVQASAPRSITCNGTQWSELQLQCKGKSCGNPGDILHGNYEFTDIVFGAVITAVCNEGYHLLGPSTRRCRETGWDKRAPVCESVKCQKPLDITNGVFEPVKETYDYGEGIHYSCNRGFDIFGPEGQTCSSNATFQPALPPQCLSVSCEKPEILHARRTEGKSPPYKYRQFVQYECNEGYKIEGSGRLTCTEKGWNPAPPQCNVITCTNPPNITNGLFNPRKEFYDYKEKVTYSCNKGFSLTEASSISCTLDGTFEPLLSQCSETVCPSPVIPNGFVNGSSQKTYTYNAQVRISCNEGYKIEASDILTCKEHGWSPSVLHCIEITCDEPNIPSANIARGKAIAYKYKSSIEVQCFTGNKMEGSGLLSCGKNGWNSTLPKCSPVTCSPPPSINNGQFTLNLMKIYKYKQTVTYSCDEGYKLHGASTTTCTEQGRFQDPPQCLAVTCDKPDISNGFIIKGESPFYTRDSSVLVECNSGYRRTGSEFLICKESGWDPPSSHCSLGLCAWIMISLAVLLGGGVGVCCCLKKNKLSELVSPKKRSDNISNFDQCALVQVTSSASPAEESLVKSVN